MKPLKVSESVFKNAEFIWIRSMDEVKNAYVDFHEKLKKKEGAKSHLYIIADQNYALYVNCKYCDGFPAEPSERLVRLAQRVRSHFDAPVIITSGVRCQTHNRNVGGVEGSWHRMGSAMDLAVRGVPGETVLKFVLEQPQTRYAYNIDGTCVHMDVGAP